MCVYIQFSKNVSWEKMYAFMHTFQKKWQWNKHPLIPFPMRHLKHPPGRYVYVCPFVPQGIWRNLWNDTQFNTVQNTEKNLKLLVEFRRKRKGRHWVHYYLLHATWWINYWNILKMLAAASKHFPEHLDPWCHHEWLHPRSSSSHFGATHTTLGCSNISCITSTQPN